MPRPPHRELLFVAVLLLILAGACWWFLSDTRKQETIGSLPTGAAERDPRGISPPSAQEGRSGSAAPPRSANKARETLHFEKATLLGDSWRITTGAAEAAGITDEERAKAQAVVDRMKREMEESVKERLVPDEAVSDPSKDIRAYKLCALPDRGAGFLGRYKNELRSAVGDGKGDILYGALRTDVAFGAYGQYDVDLKFYPSSRASAAGKHALEWISRDPVTKEALWTSGAVDEVVDRFWGDVFK